MIGQIFMVMYEKKFLLILYSRLENQSKWTFLSAQIMQGTCLSQTGILLCLKKAPILWYSKLLKTMETSFFGSEFVVLRVATEMIKGMRYKLRKMGIPMEGPAIVLIDNETFMKNSTIPSSTLQRKHNAICYHFEREAVASSILRIAHIPTDQNLADMLTKMLGVTKLQSFCRQI